MVAQLRIVIDLYERLPMTLLSRLLVRSVGPEAIRATCRGNGAIYRLGYERGGWYCDCPALGRCAHLVALQLVAVRPG